MKYRAILFNGPQTNKPVQGFAASPEAIKDWAKNALEQVDAKVYPLAEVWIYESSEVLYLTIPIVKA